MKKVILVLVVVLVAFNFSSCTDLTDDLITEEKTVINENLQAEQALSAIEPGEDGTIDDEDEETGQE